MKLCFSTEIPGIIHEDAFHSNGFWNGSISSDKREKAKGRAGSLFASDAWILELFSGETRSRCADQITGCSDEAAPFLNK
jgi:hypothetical protein